MATQHVSNERKKELRQMDPLQRNLLRAMAFAGTYKKPLLFAAGAAVVVGLVFAGIVTSFKRSENTASDRVARAVAQYRTLSDDPEAAYQAVKDDFQTVLADYSNTDAGRMALVRFAGICMEAGHLDEAEKWFERALEVFGDQAGLRNFLLSSLGHVHLARNDLAQAESCFVQIETGGSDLLRDEARFILAKIYDARQDGAGTREMVDRIAQEHGGSIYADLARSMVKQPATVQ